MRAEAAAAGADAATRLQMSAAENRSLSERIGAKGAEARCVGRLHDGGAEWRTKARCQCHVWMENLTEWQ